MHPPRTTHPNQDPVRTCPTTRADREQPVTSASDTLLGGLNPDEWLRAVDFQDQRPGTVKMTPCHGDLPTRWHPAERPHQRLSRQGTAASA